MAGALRSSFLAVVLLAVVAQATTLVALDLPALTSRSGTVVRGTVRSVSARWTKDGGRIMTDAVLDVSETWKGAPVREVTVMQPGGEVGDVGQLVHGTVKFKAGDEVVLFLEPRGTNFLLTGMVQSVFRVERSTDGRAIFVRQEASDVLLLDPTTHQPVTPSAEVQTLDALRAKVLSLAGATVPPEPSRPSKVSP